MGGAAGAIIYGGEIMNYTMNTLKAIGIILVICGHNGTTLLNWFAPYSFHMALFLFISGYFYKPANEDNLIVYIKKKAKSLIVPYYGWNIFYAILVAALLNVNLINFGCNIDLRFFLIEPWITGHQYIFNLAGWFIFALFNVMLLVALIRKISRNYIRSEYVLTVLFFLISLCGVYLAIHKGYTTDLSLVISRTMFGVFFFQLGYLYKEKLEEKDRFSLIILIAIIIFQGWVLYRTQNSTAYVMAFMSFTNKNILLPFFTSVTGVYLYLNVAKIITVYDGGKDKLLKLIGRSTWSIMLHHIFGMWLLNLSFYLLKIYGVAKFHEFDIIKFKADIWYRYLFLGDFTFVLYFLAGLSVSIMLKIAIDKMRSFVKGYL